MSLVRTKSGLNFGKLLIYSADESNTVASVTLPVIRNFFTCAWVVAVNKNNNPNTIFFIAGF